MAVRGWTVLNMYNSIISLIQSNSLWMWYVGLGRVLWGQHWVGLNKYIEHLTKRSGPNKCMEWPTPLLRESYTWSYCVQSLVLKFLTFKFYCRCGYCWKHNACLKRCHRSSSCLAAWWIIFWLNLWAYTSHKRSKKIQRGALELNQNMLAEKRTPLYHLSWNVSQYSLYS